MLQPAGGPSVEMLDVFAKNPPIHVWNVSEPLQYFLVYEALPTRLCRDAVFFGSILGIENGTDTDSQEAWLHAD